MESDSDPPVRFCPSEGLPCSQSTYHLHAQTVRQQDMGHNGHRRASIQRLSRFGCGMYALSMAFDGRLLALCRGHPDNAHTLASNINHSAREGSYIIPSALHIVGVCSSLMRSLEGQKSIT